MSFPAHLHDEIPVSRKHLKLHDLGQLSFFEERVGPSPASTLEVVDEPLPPFRIPPKPHGKAAAANDED